MAVLTPRSDMSQTPRSDMNQADIFGSAYLTRERRSWFSLRSLSSIFSKLALPKLALFPKLALGLILVACGSGITEPELAPPPVCAAGQIDGDLILMSRENQIPLQVVEDFERRYGIDVEHLIYESEDDLLTRVTAGAGDFDVLVTADYLAEILRRADSLFPLDPIALPGRINLDPVFFGLASDLNPFYSVPLVWGTVGIGLNLNMVGENVDPSWGLIFDTSRSWVFAGRATLLEEGRQVMAAAMFYLGYSPNLDDRRRVAEAAALVAEARAVVRRFESVDYASDLVEGGLDVAHGRSDKFLAALPPDSGDFRYIIPREGAVIWLDTLAIPRTSKHPCTAHSFVDFVLEPRIGADVANHTRAATPNEAALEYVLPELVIDPLVYPPSEVRSRLETLNYSEDINRLYAEQYLLSDPS